MDTYRHSGAITLSGLLLSLLIGALCALVLGFVYAWATVWMPSVEINSLLTLAFGAALGCAVGWTAVCGKIRNSIVVAILAAALALLGLAVAWAADMRARSMEPNWYVDHGYPWLVLDWATMRSYVHKFYDEGMWRWRFSAEPVHGPLLGLIWLLEAVGVVAASSAVAWLVSCQHPFCERCQQSIPIDKNVQRLSLANNLEAAQSLRRGDLAVLRTLLPVAENQPCAHYLRLDLACCRSCQESSFLSAHVVRQRVDDKGKISLKTSTLVSLLRITPSDVDRIRKTRDGLRSVRPIVHRKN